MMKKKMWIFLLMVSMLFIFNACSSEKKTDVLVGEWENSGGDVFTFYESGDFKHEASGNSGNNYTGTFSTTSETEVKLTTKRNEFICEYSIDGDELHIDCSFMGKGEQTYTKK